MFSKLFLALVVVSVPMTAHTPTMPRPITTSGEKILQWESPIICKEYAIKRHECAGRQQIVT
jgi:hypothetical protein